MIYRCSSKDCGYWCEGEMLEGAACPWCGKELLRAEEKNMSGDDWAALGGFWSEQGAKGRREWPSVSGKPPISAALGAPAIWASVWSRAMAWSGTRSRRFGCTARRWKWVA